MGAFGARRRGTGAAFIRIGSRSVRYREQALHQFIAEQGEFRNAGQARKAKALQSRFMGRPERLWPDANAASPLADPRGLIFGANGSLYVCSVGGSVSRQLFRRRRSRPAPPRESLRSSSVIRLASEFVSGDRDSHFWSFYSRSARGSGRLRSDYNETQKSQVPVSPRSKLGPAGKQRPPKVEKLKGDELPPPEQVD